MRWILVLFLLVTVVSCRSPQVVTQAPAVITSEEYGWRETWVYEIRPIRSNEETARSEYWLSMLLRQIILAL